MATVDSLAGITTTAKRAFCRTNAYAEFQLDGRNEELWRRPEALATRFLLYHEPRKRYW